MKKKNFVTLAVGVLGGLLFGIGMCMCLLPEWNAFNTGVVLTAIGFIALLILFIVRMKIDGRKMKMPNAKALGTVLYGIVSVLVLGTGMCMIMVWEIMLWGILVGVMGIGLLLGLIPMIKGLK